MIKPIFKPFLLAAYPVGMTELLIFSRKYR